MLSQPRTLTIYRRLSNRAKLANIHFSHKKADIWVIKSKI